MALIDNLIKDGWLRTASIIDAFQKIKREDFLPEDMKNLASINEALPIGDGQTISQPLVVVFMLEHLQPQKGQRILDIGAGSGWTTALLAEIVGEKGRVIGIEIVERLREFGERNIRKYDFIESGIVKFMQGDGRKGYIEEAPFDRILCSASVQKEIPKAWKDQLKVGGIMVTPVNSSIWVLIKESEDNFKEIEYPGFAFVPLIGEGEQ